jgi:hypothetical protein
MSQYRNGIINSTGAAVTLALGFVPDKFEIYNKTVLDAASATPAVGYSLWIKDIVANAKAYINTYTSGAPVTTLLASNGITPVILGADWQNTQYTITAATKANPGVITVTSVSPTNSLTLVNGMTFTISGVVGMTQLNQNRYVVAGISGTSFNLYDTFGNPVDTTAFGTYVSGGIINVISYPPIAPVIDAVTGQITTQGQPAGNQYDIGYEGLTLGTGVVGANTNVLYWEAWLETPTGY